MPYPVPCKLSFHPPEPNYFTLFNFCLELTFSLLLLSSGQHTLSLPVSINLMYIMYFFSPFSFSFCSHLRAAHFFLSCRLMNKLNCGAGQRGANGEGRVGGLLHALSACGERCGGDGWRDGIPTLHCLPPGREPHACPKRYHAPPLRPLTFLFSPFE